MNDLMRKSFLSYDVLKMRTEGDLESGPHEEDDNNLSLFFQEIEPIKAHMKEINHLLLDLQNLNEETKSTYSSKILRGLRDRMDSDMVSVLRKAQLVKTRLESLDKSNLSNRKISVKYSEGSAVDRTRISTTNSLRTKLKEVMTGFHTLREKIMSDYKEGLRRRYFSATGEEATEEIIEKMVFGNGEAIMKVFEKQGDVDAENKAVMDIWRSLNKLHQVFLDMAVIVEAQGEGIDDIEKNMAVASSFVSGGTRSLFYAEQMKKKKKNCGCFWVWAIGFLVVLVCLLAMLTN